MLIAFFPIAALPAIERFEIGITNSRDGYETESFCDSLKRSFGPRPSMLVGASSSNTYETALRSYVDALGLGNEVEITGGVPHAALMAYYDTADVFVVCSEHEGFCVPLLEAMHHRIPIVAYAAAAVPETLDDAGLVLHMKDPCTIAEGVQRVLTDDALREQLVGAGTRRLRAFEIERSRQKLLDAVGSIL